LASTSNLSSSFQTYFAEPVPHWQPTAFSKQQQPVIPATGTQLFYSAPPRLPNQHRINQEIVSSTCSAVSTANPSGFSQSTSVSDYSRSVGQSQQYLHAYPRANEQLSLVKLRAACDFFRDIPKFKDPETDDIFDFLRRCDEAAQLTGLSEEAVKVCFVNTVAFDRVTWASHLDLWKNSLDEFVMAFLNEFYSSGVQQRIYQRFEADQRPTTAEEFARWCDRWFAVLSWQTKPLLDFEMILELLIGKHPQSTAAQVIRHKTFKNYEEFQDTVLLGWMPEPEDTQRIIYRSKLRRRNSRMYNRRPRALKSSASSQYYLGLKTLTVNVPVHQPASVANSTHSENW